MSEPVLRSTFPAWVVILWLSFSLRSSGSEWSPCVVVMRPPQSLLALPKCLGLRFNLVILVHLQYLELSVS